MTTALECVEQRLIEGFRRQSREYDRAADILAGGSTTTGATDWAHDLNDVLRGVNDHDSALAADKAAWRQSGRTPGPELRALLDRLASQIRNLEAEVAIQVAGLSARKQALVPAIDDFVRQRWMLAAYANRPGTSPE